MERSRRSDEKTPMRWTQYLRVKLRVCCGRRGQLTAVASHRDRRLNRQPSSINGIVGIKPTVGLVSRQGDPISHSQDTPGPMARTVRDAAILLGVLAAQIRRTRPPKPAAFLRITRNTWTPADSGSEIGVVRKYFGFHDGVDAS